MSNVVMQFLLFVSGA